jgi:hypothetical protein
MAMTMTMTMGNMLACDYLFARLFAVVMAMAMIVAAMLFLRMHVASLFVVVMLMVMIMASMLTCRWIYAACCWLMLMVMTIWAVVGSAMLLWVRSMMRRTFLRRLSTAFLSQQQHAVHDHQQACTDIRLVFSRRLRTEVFGQSRKMTFTHHRAGSVAGTAT